MYINGRNGVYEIRNAIVNAVATWTLVNVERVVNSRTTKVFKQSKARSS